MDSPGKISGAGLDTPTSPDAEAEVVEELGEAPAHTPFDLATIQHRAFRGVLSLAVREVAVRLLGFAGTIILARLLDPAAFGLFAIASFAISLFSLFSELGFGAAFIRKQGEVSRHELDALFTFQLSLVTLLAVIIFVAAPLIADFYREPSVAWLVRALSVSLFLTSLRSVPIVEAERSLRYGPIALADVSGLLAYWLVAVVMAAMGFGVWSLVAAVISSGLVGTALLYASTRWRPSLQFDWGPLRQNLKFGALYQGQTIAHFFKDTMIPALGGVAYGAAAVGYLSWANQLAALPLQLTQLVSRVSYPALARLQDDPKAYTGMVESTLKWTARVSLPAFAVIAGLSPQIVQYIYSPKWQPALPSLYILLVNMVLGIGTGILLPALYSIGRAGPALTLSALWAALTWITAVVLIAAGASFESIAAAYSLSTGIALALIIFEMRDLLSIRLFKAVVLPLLSGSVTAAALYYYVGPFLVHSVWSLLLAVVAGGGLSLLVNVWSDRETALRAAKSAIVKRGTAPRS